MKALVRRWFGDNPPASSATSPPNADPSTTPPRVLQWMFSRLRDGVLWIDDRGGVVASNDAAAELLNLSPRTINAAPRAADVIRVPDIRDAIVDTMRTGHPNRFECDIAVDATHRSIAGSTDALTIEDRRWTLVLIQDQTERFEMESLRRDLTANLSHELKTPLAAIKGYAETIDLAIEDDVDAARHFMNQLHDQCRRMENMIADMLQLTRVQSQEGELQIGPVALSSVLADAISTAEILAAQKQMTLQSRCGTDIEIQTDRESLLTILNNLIGNAVHYTPSGGQVIVDLDVHADQVRIVVEDNGVGIAAKDQAKVFQRFYRVQRIGRADRSGGPSRGGVRSGTGLGLSIVQTLVQSLGGEVTLTSRLGQGSRFEVTLPIQSDGSASSKLHNSTDRPTAPGPKDSIKLSS